MHCFNTTERNISFVIDTRASLTNWNGLPVHMYQSRRLTKTNWPLFAIFTHRTRTTQYYIMLSDVVAEDVELATTANMHRTMGLHHYFGGVSPNVHTRARQSSTVFNRPINELRQCIHGIVDTLLSNPTSALTSRFNTFNDSAEAHH